MKTLSSKLTAFVMAVTVNSLIMGAMGYLFEVQAHPAVMYLNAIA